MPTKYKSLMSTNVYSKPTASSMILDMMNKGVEINVYTTANSGKWLCLDSGGTQWVPMYNSNSQPIFQTTEPMQKSTVSETKAEDVNKSTGASKSSYFYIGTNWNDGKAVNQEGNAFKTKSDAMNYYNGPLSSKGSQKSNYKIYDSNGNKVYPTTNEPTTATTSVSAIEDTSENEADIDWIEVYGLEGDAGSSYVKSIESLTIKNVKGIMGLPYQWTPLQDPRITSGNGKKVGDNSGIGRTYGDKILSRVPLLLITPGVPDFMGSYSDKQAETLLGKMLQSVGDDTDIDKNDSALKSIITRQGKYYNLKFDYASYYSCVNPMCRAAAYFLGIQNKKIDNEYLKRYDHYKHNRSELDSFLGTYRGCVPFYVNSETSIQDSFGNDTSQSSLADKINGYSSMANELSYILGNSKAGDLYDDLKSTVDNSVEGLGNLVHTMMGGTNLISSITDGLTSVLAGGKLIFPEIWSDSSFTRSYDVTVKLVTPDNDKLSWFLNIWVPLAHLMALCLPRQVDVNGYISPFLVRAFYKGLFNVDMGIITNMSVQKGGDGLWTKDGLPTSVEVSFTIKDLYNYMALSNDPSITNNLMNNITLLDYIGNSCGININETDVIRNVEMFLMVGEVGTVQDQIVNGVFTNLDQWFTNRVAKIFGYFN